MNLNDLYNQTMEKIANQDPKSEIENTEETGETEDADLDALELTEEEVEEAVNEVDNSLNAAETYIELGRELAKKDYNLMQS